MFTQNELKNQLTYNHDTGLFTKTLKTPKIFTNKICGCLTAQGYIVIVLNKISYKAHRLAWFYVNGKWPVKQIDHINGIKNDNRIINLREATNSENQKNRGKQSNNTSGYKGVSFHKLSNKWIAKATLNGIKNHIGLFVTPEQARDAYQNFAQKNHINFYYSGD